MESLCLRDHFSSSPPVFATDGLPHHRKFSQCWQQSRCRRPTRGTLKLRIPHVPHGGARHPLESRCNEAGTGTSASQRLKNDSRFSSQGPSAFCANGLKPSGQEQRSNCSSLRLRAGLPNQSRGAESLECVRELAQAAGRAVIVVDHLGLQSCWSSASVWRRRARSPSGRPSMPRVTSGGNTRSSTKFIRAQTL